MYNLWLVGHLLLVLPLFLYSPSSVILRGHEIPLCFFVGTKLFLKGPAFSGGNWGNLVVKVVCGTRTKMLSCWPITYKKKFQIHRGKKCNLLLTRGKIESWTDSLFKRLLAARVQWVTESHWFVSFAVSLSLPALFCLFSSACLHSGKVLVPVGWSS